MSEIQFSQDYLPVAVLRLYANVGSCVQVHSLQSHNGTISPPPPARFTVLSMISLSIALQSLSLGRHKIPFKIALNFVFSRMRQRGPAMCKQIISPHL